jgi:hypothetical protein
MGWDGKNVAAETFLMVLFPPVAGRQAGWQERFRGGGGGVSCV